jgi:hypothetical protein
MKLLDGISTFQKQLVPPFSLCRQESGVLFHRLQVTFDCAVNLLFEISCTISFTVKVRLLGIMSEGRRCIVLIRRLIIFRLSLLSSSSRIKVSDTSTETCRLRDVF